MAAFESQADEVKFDLMSKYSAADDKHNYNQIPDSENNAQDSLFPSSNKNI